MDGSVEITALGSPVNLLSRMDEATKHPSLEPLISSSDILLTEKTYELLPPFMKSLRINRIDLGALSIKIRNFETERCLYSLSPCEHNLESAKRITRLVESTSPLRI
jgi:class 3 adenylate cyclase